MSLENNLKRIADALEALVKTVQQDVNPVVSVTVDPAPVPAPTSVVALTPAVNATPIPTPTAPVTPAPAPAPAPAPTNQVAPPVNSMTPEEMNDALVIEFKRLKTREPIDKAMADLGVTSVNDLEPVKQNELLATIRAIAPAVAS